MEPKPLLDPRKLLGVPGLELDTEKVRDIRPLFLDDAGRFKILPAEAWKETTVEERALFGLRTGIYSFPTTELVARLNEIIGGRSAIEIGAGNGVLAEALHIPATDSRQQDQPDVRLIYELTGQPPVTYGPNVVKVHASRAVRDYKPEVVVGCWVTHKRESGRPEAKGNPTGIDERDVMMHCDTYVFVGNEQQHQYSRVWEKKPAMEYPDWLYSRAHNGSRNFIAIVNRPRRRA